LEQQIAEKRENEEKLYFVFIDELKLVKADIPNRIETYRMYTDVRIVVFGVIYLMELNESIIIIKYIVAASKYIQTHS